jgi:hypothetical protein
MKWVCQPICLRVDSRKTKIDRFEVKEFCQKSKKSETKWKNSDTYMGSKSLQIYWIKRILLQNFYTSWKKSAGCIFGRLTSLQQEFIVNCVLTFGLLTDNVCVCVSVCVHAQSPVHADFAECKSQVVNTKWSLLVHQLNWLVSQLIRNKSHVRVLLVATFGHYDFRIPKSHNTWCTQLVYKNSLLTEQQGHPPGMYP